MELKAPAPVPLVACFISRCFLIDSKFHKPNTSRSNSTITQDFLVKHDWNSKQIQCNQNLRNTEPYLPFQTLFSGAISPTSLHIFCEYLRGVLLHHNSRHRTSSNRRRSRRTSVLPNFRRFHFHRRILRLDLGITDCRWSRRTVVQPRSGKRPHRFVIKVVLFVVDDSVLLGVIVGIGAGAPGAGADAIEIVIGGNVGGKRWRVVVRGELALVDWGSGGGGSGGGGRVWRGLRAARAYWGCWVGRVSVHCVDSERVRVLQSLGF